MNRKLLVVLSVLSLASFGLAACGDDGGDSGGEPAATSAETTEQTTTEASGGADGGMVEVTADPDGALAYTTGDLTASAGEVEVDFDNPSSTAHDVRVEGPEGEDVGGTDVISGETATATVELDPGSYTYYCSVDNHREAGMEATLEVK